MSRIRRRLGAALGMTWCALGCRAATGASNGASGLEGVVLRGPVTPVCRVDVPCDAPFSARFHVLRGTEEVSEFTSDTAGRFVVALAPGRYVVVPDSTAPILAARFQTRVVTVDSGSVTPVTLSFDTGIR